MCPLVWNLDVLSQREACGLVSASPFEKEGNWGPPRKVSCLDEGKALPPHKRSAGIQTQAPSCSQLTLLTKPCLRLLSWIQRVCYSWVPGTVVALYKYHLVFTAAPEGKVCYGHPHLLERYLRARVSSGVPRAHTAQSGPSTMRLCCLRRYGSEGADKEGRPSLWARENMWTSLQPFQSKWKRKKKKKRAKKTSWNPKGWWKMGGWCWSRMGQMQEHIRKEPVSPLEVDNSFIWTEVPLSSPAWPISEHLLGFS